VVNLSERGKDEGGGLHSFSAQRSDHRKSVELRQHPVDNEHVIIAFAGKRETVLAIDRYVGDMTNLAESFGEVVGGGTIVFNDQQAHEYVDISRRAILAESREPCASMRSRGGGSAATPRPTPVPAGATDAGTKIGLAGTGT